MMFFGSGVALVTPMQADGSIDYQAFAQLIDWHMEAGTSAVIVAGTTGESPTVTPREQRALIELAVQQMGTKKRRIPIIAGTGTNSTQTTIEHTKAALEVGADACLIVTPYYNKPTQKGLYAHYKAVAEAVPLPIILYNVPGRTGCDMAAETVASLAKIHGIIGIKEATGVVARVKAIREQCGQHFFIYSGDDVTGLAAMCHGANGVISVTANVMPRSMRTMCFAAYDKDIAQAEAIDQVLAPLHKQLFCEANPIPVKWALQALGKIPVGIRLPLTPLDSQYHAPLQEALNAAQRMEAGFP